MRIVGAGLGRTGTLSLKDALERLLGGRCYHMMEVFGRPDDISVWQRAIDGDPPDWADFLGEFDAAVDWPVAAFWRELADAFPDAPVLLSTRDTDGWWTSASNTIFRIQALPSGDDPLFAAHRVMALDMFTKRFTPNWQDEAGAKAAFERHNAEVRATIAPDRLVEWRPGDGWGPLCASLGVEVPDEPYPHVNTTEEFRAMIHDLDEPA